MSNIQNITKQASGNKEAQNPDENVGVEHTEAVKNDKQQQLSSRLSVMRTQQEIRDCGYSNYNTECINKAYKSIIRIIFYRIPYFVPVWVILLLLLVPVHIFGNIDEGLLKELSDCRYMPLAQNIARIVSETFAALFLFMLAVPSAKGIRRLFSKIMDRISK